MHIIIIIIESDAVLCLSPFLIYHQPGRLSLSLTLSISDFATTLRDHKTANDLEYFFRQILCENTENAQKTRFILVGW